MQVGRDIPTGTRLRVALAVVVVLVNVVHQSALAVLAWVLLVVAVDLATGFALTSRSSHQEGVLLTALPEYADYRATGRLLPRVVTRGLTG